MVGLNNPKPPGWIPSHQRFSKHEVSAQQGFSDLGNVKCDKQKTQTNKQPFFLSFNQMSPKRLPPFLYGFTSDWFRWPYLTRVNRAPTYTRTFTFLSQVL